MLEAIAKPLLSLQVAPKNSKLARKRDHLTQLEELLLRKEIRPQEVGIQLQGEAVT